MAPLFTGMTQYPKGASDGLPPGERILWIAGALGLIVAGLLTVVVVFATVGTEALSTSYLLVTGVFTLLLAAVIGAMRRYGTPRRR